MGAEQLTENKRNFTHRASPGLEKSFLILEKMKDGSLSPVGDYYVLDPSEDMELAEMKVMNLVKKLNKESDLLLFGDRTKSRMLFQVCDTREGENKQVVFYTYTGEGVSSPSGVLTLEPSLIPDKRGLALLCAAASCPLSLDLIFEDAAKPGDPLSSSPIDPSPDPLSPAPR
jgi:hypothetical protein